MPTIAQRRARRSPFRWTIELTGMVASLAAMVVMVPALAVDGDFACAACFHAACRPSRRSHRYVAGANRRRSFSHPRIRFIHRFRRVRALGQRTEYVACVA